MSAQWLRKALCLVSAAALAGCIQTVYRKAYVHDKTYKVHSDKVREQSRLSNHPLIGMYELRAEGNKAARDLNSADAVQGLLPYGWKIDGVMKIAGVHRGNSIDFVSLSYLAQEAPLEPFVPSTEFNLHGATFWSVPFVTDSPSTRKWDGVFTGIYDVDGRPGTASIEIIGEEWIRIVTSSKSYFLKKSLFTAKDH